MRIEKKGVDALARASRAWGVTRADLMIALLMKAIAPLAGDARHKKRRREIGIAWIVNIRREFGTSLRESFGQFLSSYRCAHPVPEGAALRDLARDVHRETAKVRRRKLYLVTLLALAGLGFLWRWLSPRQKGSVDAKHYPAWAGLTPLDVDAVWREASGAAAPAEYLRAVSTGPASPRPTYPVAPRARCQRAQLDSAYAVCTAARGPTLRYSSPRQAAQPSLRP